MAALGGGALCSFVEVAPRERNAVQVGRGVGGFKGLPCRRNGRGASRPVVAVGRNGLARNDGFEEGNEAIKATLEKSRKVLDMQKDLIRELVERRKLVAAIKDTIVEEGVDGLDESFRKLNMTLTSKDATTLFSGDIAVLPSTEATETTVVQNERIMVEEKKMVYSLQTESSIADTIGLSRELSEVSTNSMVMPTTLPKISEPDLQGKKLELPTEELIKEDFDQHVAFDEVTVKPPPLAGDNVMNLILVSAECAPWSKTGGLGDVVGTLPKALARRGHRVMVVAPKYGNYAETQAVGDRKIYNVDGQDMEVTYHHAYIDGVDFVFIDSAIFRNWDNNIYGGGREDILKRMVLLCKVAVEVPWNVPCGGICYGDGNLVFIANDWHTALLPVYLRAYYRDSGMMRYTRCVFVIHNIAHQGRGPVNDFRYLGLPPHYLDLFKFYDPVGGEHCNIFLGGLKASDRVVTVSRGYAWELKTSEGGWGLHEVIRENDWKFQGIVNGIDTNDWNPERDIYLKSDGYTNYNAETLLTGKPQCKAALQRELGFPSHDGTPLVGFIGRLDYQKGIDLIEQAIPWMAGQDLQFVMLGTGRTDLEEILKAFESKYYGKVRAWIGFSVKMAHRITAGADILLMPSRFEPCGLNQLHAMMYGTVPVVHAVGGLRDTVQQFDPFNNAGHGWTFDRAETIKLIDAMGNCLNTYRSHKSSWEGLQRRGMAQDLSWDNAAQLYEEVLVAAKYQW